MRVLLSGGLLLGGLALLLVGQAQLAQGGAQGVWSLAGGLLLLVGAAVLALCRRFGPKAPPLVGEYRGLLASEEGFVPMREAAEAQREQTQRRVVGKPERAAESVRGLLAEQLRQGKGGTGAARDGGKRRNRNG